MIARPLESEKQWPMRGQEALGDVLGQPFHFTDREQALRGRDLSDHKASWDSHRN